MPDQPRPWQTDAELESQSRGSYGGGGGAYGYPTVYQRIKPPQPRATYGILIAMAVVFALEWLTILTQDSLTFYNAWAIHTRPAVSPAGVPYPASWGWNDGPWYDWIYRPWSPFTATFAHSPDHISHILFNALALYFFGPMCEQVMGRFRFVVFVILTGALSSIAQASIDHGPALGISGALMALIGVAIIINPKAKMLLLFVPVPVPLWVGGLIFAALDVLGALSGGSGVGNIAHLAGLVVGLLYGLPLKAEMKAKGMVFMSS